MERKLIKQGTGNGLAIYVPKKWIDKNELKPGDKLNVLEQYDDLILSTKNKDLKAKKVQIVSEDESIIRIQINSLYRGGYDQLVCDISSQKQIDIVKDIIKKYTLGFEITSSIKNSITLEIISEPSPEKFEVLVRRIFFLIEENFNNIQNLDVVENNVYKIGQYDNFCRRCLITHKINRKGSDTWKTLIRSLAIIAHSQRHLSENYQKFDQFEEINCAIRENFKEMHHNFYKENYEKILFCANKLKWLLNDDLFGISVKINEQRKTLHYLRELARLIYLLSVPMLELILLK